MPQEVGFLGRPNREKSRRPRIEDIKAAALLRVAVVRREIGLRAETLRGAPADRIAEEMRLPSISEAINIQRNVDAHSPTSSTRWGGGHFFVANSCGLDAIQFASFEMMARLAHLLLIVAVVVCFASVALASEEEEEEVFKPAKKSVVSRNLVATKATANSIVKEHAKYYVKTGIKNFKGTVLAYVTPWFVSNA